MSPYQLKSEHWIAKHYKHDRVYIETIKLIQQETILLNAIANRKIIGYVYVFREKIGSTKCPRTRIYNFNTMERKKRGFSAIFAMINMECSAVDTMIKEDKNRKFRRFREMGYDGGTELYQHSPGNTLREDLIEWFKDNHIQYIETHPDPMRYPTKAQRKRHGTWVPILRSNHDAVATDAPEGSDKSVQRLEAEIQTLKQQNIKYRQEAIDMKKQMDELNTKYRQEQIDMTKQLQAAKKELEELKTAIARKEQSK
mmetsp:Transcript_4013/g.3487  ORF Transcript_4013/g.3487 Transcript_4013/m.3487 type:complete len:255 (+) Transcript_4013:26-790(+)